MCLLTTTYTSQLSCMPLHAHMLYQNKFLMSKKYLKFYTAFHINEIKF